MKKRKTLQASFNLMDSFERELLEHALKNDDVSKYIKRLIFMDKEGFRNTAVPIHEPPHEEEKIQIAMKSVRL